MFKKATLVRQEKLSGQAVKRLKKDLTLQTSLTDDEVEAAIPGKADVMVLRLSNKALVYAVDGRNPIVFDPVRDLHNELLPNLTRQRHRRARASYIPRCICCGLFRRRCRRF